MFQQVKWMTEEVGLEKTENVFPQLNRDKAALLLLRY